MHFAASFLLFSTMLKCRPTVQNPECTVAVLHSPGLFYCLSIFLSVGLLAILHKVLIKSPMKISYQRLSLDKEELIKVGKTD